MDSSAIERRSWSRLNQFIALVPNTREHELFFASRLLAVTALEVSSVLGINFGSEGVRVAFLGCADGLVANIRELLRVLAVGALAVSTHHQRSETLAVSAFVRAGCVWINECTARYTSVCHPNHNTTNQHAHTYNLRHLDFLQLHALR